MNTTSCCSNNEQESKTIGFTPREQIIETVNKLFVYTDKLDWDKIKSEVFSKEVNFDMTSSGGEKEEILTSEAICEMWDTGLKDLDAVHHQAGNYIIDITDHTANVTAYAIASHYKKDTQNGNIRKFTGSYDLHLIQTKSGWRIDKFRFNLKYMDGNIELK